MVTQFSVQLRDQVDIDVLGEDLRGVVDQVLAIDDVYAAIEKRVIALTRATPVGAR